MKKPECAICGEANLDNSYGWVDGTGLVHKICYNSTRPQEFVREEAPRSTEDEGSVTVGVDTQKVGSKTN